MKRVLFYSTIFFILLTAFPVEAQKRALKSITIEDLKFHMEFLASDEMEGRATGEPGLLMAADYLESAASGMGLVEAIPGAGMRQNYVIQERSYEWEKSFITIASNMDDGDGNDSISLFRSEEQFFVFPSIKANSWEVAGEVVFAGYGMIEENFDYDDLEGIDIRDKIVLMMSRAPMNEDGSECQFGARWMNLQSFQYKMDNLMARDPKAILLVMDPKSGFNSVTDISPGIARYLSRSRGLKSEQEVVNDVLEGPRMVMIHRELADQLLVPYGKTLDQLQREIDETLEPNSFDLGNQQLRIQLTMKNKDLKVPNIFGVIEGSDPELKNEYVIYVAHYDHVGTDGKGGVYNGADDNASGTVALLEMAEAFLKERKHPKRSVGFLWVSAEEIGLFGSRYFANNPMVPVEQISTVINLDMVGRVVSPEDKARGRERMTIVGRDSVKVIGGLQSSVLMELNQQTLQEMELLGNYSYNDPAHPERYYYRSDHINFARKDIPVLFYSTGTHSDYHELTDVAEKIDYDKFLKMTRFGYKAGFNIANYPEAIEVDNPMSEWE